MTTSISSAERAPRLLSAEETLLPLRRSYFSELIQTIFLREADARCRPTMFTSPTPGAGVSFISSYVATELAGLGGKVLLADGQTLIELSRGAATEGLKRCERIDLSRLWVLGPKQVATHAREERGAVSSVASVLTALTAEFTQIIVDAPALSVSDDAVSLATSVYGTVLVAQQGATAKQDILRASKTLTSLGGRVLGSIYNARNPETEGGTRS